MRSSETRNEAADRLIDVLLESELGGINPPDLTDQILARLAALETASSSAAALTLKRSVKPRSNPWLRRLAIAASLLVAVALGAYWSRHDPAKLPDEMAQNNAASNATENPRPSPSHSNVAQAEKISTGKTEPSRDATAIAPESITPQPAPSIAKDKPVRERLSPEPLPLPELVASGTSIGRDPKAVSESSKQTPTPLADAAIVAAIDREFQALWKSAGFIGKGKDKDIEIETNSNDWRSRMVSLVSAGHQSSISSPSADPLDLVRNNPTIWAEQWLAQLVSAEALKRLDDASRAQLVDRVGRVFRGEEGWDDTVRAMLNVQQPMVAKNSAAESDANTNTKRRSLDSISPDSLLLVALQSPRGVDLVDRLGPTILDEDLVCSRCHDHPLKGTLTQRDYWGLAAIFQTEVQWRQEEDLTYITTAKDQPLPVSSLKPLMVDPG